MSHEDLNAFITDFMNNNIPENINFRLTESVLWESCCGYWLLPEHLERLKGSADFFGFQLDEQKLQDGLDSITQGLEASQYLIHINLNRQGELEWSTEPTIEERTPFNATLASECINKDNMLLYHNTSNRKIYDAALTANPDYDDVILWNEDGEITESCTGNIVVELDDTFYTPPKNSGLLPGTYRTQLLKEKTIIEKPVHKDALKDYEKIYAINSRVGWRELILNGQ